MASFVFSNGDSKNALLAVPKKGRLYDRCLKLLEGVGLEYTRPARVDVAECTNFPLTLVFLPAADIATFVGKGHVDLGITGLDIVRESGNHVEHLQNLGFGKCKLCVQAPIKKHYKGLEDLAGKRIVTSFPHLAGKVFEEVDAKLNTKTEVCYVSGSVEAACGLGLADGIVDLVETGTTMRAAGLEIVHQIMETECMLIKSPHASHEEIVSVLQKRIDGYQTATKFMMITYNIERKLLSQALEITPGKRSPTISSLEEDGWMSVSALVEKKHSGIVMDKLQAIGAEDILLLPLANTRM